MNKLSKITHTRDSIRAFLYGLLEAGWQTFAFIVAIRYFNADTNVKAFIAAAGPIGFLLTPLSLYFFAGYIVYSLGSVKFLAIYFSSLFFGNYLSFRYHENQEEPGHSYWFLTEHFD